MYASKPSSSVCRPIRFVLSICIVFWALACSRTGYDTPPRVLVFSKTAGFRHASIPAGMAALRKLGAENGIFIDSTENAEDFNDKNLRRYAAVVFLSTTGDVLNPTQEVAFERYIQAGGGFMGIHAATDTEYGWGWFGGLVGAYFNGHPEIQDADLKVNDHDHLATRHLKGDTWRRKDEWYNFKNVNPNVHVLLSIDENSYKGGTMGDKHPMCWYHEYDGGRAFYTELGHTLESYAEPDFLKHLLGGLKYAIGKNKRLAYEKCRTHNVPDPTRFTKTVVADNLTEPMEFDMLPDGKILLVERRGAMKLFNPHTGQINTVFQMPVHSGFEDGLMGLALDPDYERNHWIYMYYSPIGESVNNLSRFVFKDDVLDFASEKVLLKVKTQRDECCHAGGSIQFDAEGHLFLSTGDNTNPFASDGFAPIDEQPGRSAWDAQKSSANTKDLRGKILRVKPHPDGSYTCPKDNLFAADTSKGRPEIYVMGCRNPFRISVDNRRKLLFWGEVGPDAGEPDTSRGPQGHDEINRARSAGFFGWPYFVGNNKAYKDYDFSAAKPGARFDPAHPKNLSPNNTGSVDLPPAQPAFIWYPYANSNEFPLVKNGGRNAMAGPVYYCDQYPAETRFPDYFDGKLIIYDWARSWVMAVTIDSLGNFSRMEPFADSLRFSRPMDMLTDKNGSLWVLEYGTQWFAKNPDARLSRIDYYRGNRPPMPVLQANKNAGAAPFNAVFSAAKTRDYDGDALRYEIDFGDDSPRWHMSAEKAGAYDKRRATLLASSQKAETIRLRSPLDSIAHRYEKPGIYEVVLKTTDPSGAQTTARQKVYVGNEPPNVVWNLNGRNRSFYRPGETLSYSIQVTDKEDGALPGGRIDPAAVAVTIDYLATGFDMTLIAQGHQAAMQAAEFARGKALIEQSDCKTCHAQDRQINGPSYEAIAERYKKDEFAVNNLANKIIKGGTGVWGDRGMSAHPLLSVEQAQEMVRWILSLGGAAQVRQSRPIAGQYILSVPPPEKGKKPNPGTYILKANYRDKGSSTQAPQENGEVLALRPAFLQAEQADSLSAGVLHYSPSGDTVVLRDMRDRSFFMFRRADLTGVYQATIGWGSGDKNISAGGGRIELHVDSPRGPLVGSIALPPPSNKSGKMTFSESVLPVQWRGDGRFHDLYFVLRNENAPSVPVAAVDWIRFDL